MRLHSNIEAGMTVSLEYTQYDSINDCASYIAILQFARHIPPTHSLFKTRREIKNQKTKIIDAIVGID